MGSLGRPTSTWYQSPTRSTLSATKKITTDNPQPYSPSENNSTTRHAIIQIFTPRNLQTRAQTNPSNPCIPRSPTRILHPKANSKAHYSPKTCDPNLCPTLRTTTKSEKKKKFRFTTSLHQIRSRDKRELKAHHQSRRSHQQNAAVAQPAADTLLPSLPPCCFTDSEI